MGSVIITGPRASYASYGGSRSRRIDKTPRSGTPTYNLARANGAGTVLVGNHGKDRWRVSDWSEGTGEVFGHPEHGEYQRLPDAGLRLEKTE
jgi:hypothetical protein